MTAGTQTSYDLATGGADVELVGLRRTYGTLHALDDLTLHLPAGQFVALLGPSGCGKTTALRILAGLEAPDAGTVRVAGRDLTSVPANKRDMGMVFQAYSLFPNLTARDNVAFGLRIRGRRTAERRTRADELLELVGLADKSAHFPHQLSGGQQQRVALARALAVAPKVLLLDEPLSALDAKVRASLRDEIRRLQLEMGITTLFVTHDQEEALSVADRVGVMRAGRIEQLAAPDEVYACPATPFVAEFVGTMNRLPGVVATGGRVDVLGQQLPMQPGGAARPVGQQVHVLVRPEALTVEPEEAGPHRVAARSFRGAVTRIRITLADGLEVTADTGSARAAALHPGAAARVSLPQAPVLVAEQ